MAPLRRGHAEKKSPRVRQAPWPGRCARSQKKVTRLDPFLLLDRDGPIVTVTLDRPQERNAISDSSHIAEIESFCAEAQADDSLKAVVLTGAGSAFCAGGNVKLMRDKAGMFAGSPYQLRNLPSRARAGRRRWPRSVAHWREV